MSILTTGYRLSELVIMATDMYSPTSSPQAYLDGVSFPGGRSRIDAQTWLLLWPLSG
jgi:hypothetical protein